MKKHLIAVLLTACLLFSFGTTAFADPSGGQEPNTGSANIGVTQDKKGHFGYYLSDPNATWADNQLPQGGDGNVLVEYDDNGKVKYKQQTAVAKGDTTKVISAIPTLEGHVFLGWGDKERNDQDATIRKAGDTLTYCYENKAPYTLDALWGSLKANGGTKVYDGKRFELNPAVLTLNDNGLKPELSEQYYSQLTTQPIEYSTNGTDNWTTDLSTISFTDVGTYPLYVRQTITDGENQSKVLTAQATYTITRRDVTLTSGSATKEYDGTALTNDTVTAEGFVDGEGATYTVTGAQTDVGKSENTFTYKLNDGVNENNYKINCVEGTLEVTAKTTPTPNTTPTPETTPTPTPTPVVTPAPTAAPSTDDTTPENTATPAPTATAAPTATPAPAPTAAPAAARAATTIPQTGDNFPAVALVIVMLAAIVGLGITVVLRTAKKK